MRKLTLGAIRQADSGHTSRRLGFAAVGMGILGLVAWPLSAEAAAALLGLAFLLVLLRVLLTYRHFRAVIRLHNLAMAGGHDGMWSWNPVSKELQVSPRLLAILGYAEDFLPDTHAWLRLVHPDDVADYNRAVARHLKGETAYFYCEYRVRTHNGDYRWIASRGMAERDASGRAILMAGSLGDITERKEREDLFDFMAHHDQLTGLPNRLLLGEFLPAAIETARSGQHRLAVIFLDLDRFKNINDTLGHNVGDALLCRVAERLTAEVGKDDLVVRQGGDEFIIILPRIQYAEEASTVGARLIQALAHPYAAEGYDFLVTGSFGISLFPDDGSDADTLLRCADTAMYAAKSSGGNGLRFCTGQLSDRVRDRVSLENRLRRAMEQHRLELFYQPKIALADGRLIGMEALLRWREEDGSFVPPDRFIPVAEETGLILPIGEWVIRQAIRQIRQWRDEGLNPPPVAVNLSPRQFWRGGVADLTLQCLADAGLETGVIELEVTESILLYPEGNALGELRRLHEAGVGLALDDFGTGYSSLSYLRTLPIDTLKIDRSFVAGLSQDDPSESGNAIVRAILVMAHSLDLTVVAEGVETIQQEDRLRDWQCDVGQGYLFSRPLPAPELAQRYLHRSGAPLPSLSHS